jgi:hypothetical protein
LTLPPFPIFFQPERFNIATLLRRQFH